MPAIIPLLIFCTSFLLVSMDFTKIHRIYKEYIFNIFCFVLIFIASSKTTSTSYDTNNYVLLYESVSSIKHFVPYVLGYEPGWELICILCNMLGLSYHIYFIILSVVVICIYRYVILKNCRNIFIALFTYVSCFYFLNEIIVLRHGLASALIFLESYFLAEHKNRKAFLCVILAFSVHTVAIFGLIPFAIKNEKISTKFFILIPFAFLLSDRIFLYLLPIIAQATDSSLIRMVSAKMENYLKGELSAGGIKTVIVYSISLLLTFVILHNDKRKNTFLRENSLFIILSAYFMIAFSTIASFGRINQIFLTGNIALSSFYLDEFKRKRTEIIIIPVFLAVNTYIFLRQNFFNSGGNIFY